MANRESITDYRLTDHVVEEMRRRQINEAEVAQVLFNPEQVDYVREGRKVFNLRLPAGDDSKIYLFRVFVDIDRKPPEVVTVYRTSKISKYLRNVK
jgi:hypothetical protein